MMTTKKILASSGIAVLLAAGSFGAPSTGFAAPKAEAQAPEVPVSIDPVAIGNAIADAVKSAQNRDGFVKAAREKAFYAADEKMNVMVMNTSQDYDDTGLNGVQYFDTAEYDGVTYGIWVFEDGKFVNNGDGGYINWAFRGWFDRDGGTVNFHRP
ncbi:stress protein [Metabacillus sp. GX 13764]|uniref:stress protein n=1 Tax=Metabacillus kandeliae TaxID=2900151 RepID=UPI001E36C551|nr:stress protein [Metabacillus kandeliae]MCD7034017.1 stress protein [Metabacillus kandeliae]